MTSLSFACMFLASRLSQFPKQSVPSRRCQCLFRRLDTCRLETKAAGWFKFRPISVQRSLTLGLIEDLYCIRIWLTRPLFTSRNTPS